MRDVQLSTMPDNRPEPAKEPAQPRRTPGTDMQSEDAGTPESGQPEGRGTPTEPAVKQTDKTDSESDSRG
jgi:hypothetical protein